MIKLLELLFEDDGSPRKPKRFVYRGPRLDSKPVHDPDDPYADPPAKTPPPKPTETSSGTPSTAAEEAKRLGLEYLYFGRYGKNGQVTHVTKNGKLVPFDAATHKLPALAGRGDKPIEKRKWTDGGGKGFGNYKGGIHTDAGPALKSGDPNRIKMAYENAVATYPLYHAYDKITDSALKRHGGDAEATAKWAKDQQMKITTNDPDAKLRRHAALAVEYVLAMRSKFPGHEWLWGASSPPEGMTAVDPKQAHQKWNS